MGDPTYDQQKQFKKDAETERLRGQVAYSKRQADMEELMTLCTTSLKAFLEGKAHLEYLGGHIRFVRESNG